MEQIHFEQLPGKELLNLLILFKKMYPNLSWSEDYFRWQYLNNPAGTAISFVARRGEEILGNWTAIPFEMHVRGQKRSGWRVQDVLTLPAFAGLGIYFRLSSMGNDFLKNQPKSLPFAFPNEKSHNGFIKHRWTPAMRIPLWILSDAHQIQPDRPKTTIRELTVFDPSVNSIWNAHSQRYAFALNRNDRYLNWRYFSRPGAAYKAFKLSKNQSESMLILKTFKRENGELWTHICDFFQNSDDPSMLNDALSHTIYFAKKEGSRYLSLWRPQGKSDLILSDHGFQIQRDLTRWLLVSSNDPDISSEDLCQEETWHLSMGDSDVY